LLCISDEIANCVCAQCSFTYLSSICLLSICAGLLMLASQSQCVATLTLQSVFYWQKCKITDPVYSIPVTVSGQEFRNLHLLLHDLIILMEFEHYFGGQRLFQFSIPPFHSTILFHHSVPLILDNHL